MGSRHVTCTIVAIITRRAALHRSHFVPFETGRESNSPAHPFHDVRQCAQELIINTNLM